MKRVTFSAITICTPRLDIIKAFFICNNYSTGSLSNFFSFEMV